MYEPPFTITNRIVSYVASISEKIGRITLLSDMDERGTDKSASAGFKQCISL